MTQSGWRKPTPEIVRAAELAQAGEQTSMDKSRAVVAVKRVGAALGLKAADLLLLDTLSAFSQPQDWGQGRRPIVWPSNARLMAQTGFSLSTLKRHARRLAEAGILSFHDSPNGKRWGYRDADGEIVEAYGFDLSPLAARSAEFEALAQQLAAERAIKERLRRQITIARRSIRAWLDSTGPKSTELLRIQTQFAALLDQLPSRRATVGALTNMLDALTRLMQRIEHLVAPDPDSDTLVSLNGQGSENGPHIQPTNQHHSIRSSGKEDSSSSNTSCHGAHRRNSKTCERPPTRDRVALEWGAVIRACPEFSEWSRGTVGTFKSWSDIVDAANQLTRLVGVTDRSWGKAKQTLGPRDASVALALIFEKVGADQIRSPDGYMRGILRKHAAGTLHLNRSIRGRLSAVTA
ncbi:MAG: plasmid replication protein RepC [Pseudomonadota bacterium]